MNELDMLIQSIRNIADIAEEDLTDEMIQMILNNMDEQFTPQIIEQSINQIVKNMEDQGLNKVEAAQSIEALKETLKEMLYGDEEITPHKQKLMDNILSKIFKVFDSAVEKYHSYSIELPLTLAEGAQVPSYAHDTDACADLYALEDTVVPPQTYGNKLRTGVNIQLPEGWLAMIFPRSSTGAKTSLRLSNSVGIIDSGYRGELGVLFDNTSTGAVEIKKGDRIAQLLVMPSYRFQPKVVESLEDSDRGEGGFGSTGT
jgi:dUTP pyrophosphatase